MSAGWSRVGFLGILKGFKGLPEFTVRRFLPDGSEKQTKNYKRENNLFDCVSEKENKAVIESRLCCITKIVGVHLIDRGVVILNHC